MSRTRQLHIETVRYKPPATQKFDGEKIYGSHGFNRDALIKAFVFVRKVPFAAIIQNDFEIIVRINCGISRRLIANFETQRLFIGVIFQMMALSNAHFKTGTHAGIEKGFPLTQNEGWMPGEDVDELVLLGVGVAQS